MVASPNEQSPAAAGDLAADIAMPDASDEAMQRWFSQRGLTLLLTDTRLKVATTVRAARVMVLVFVASMLFVVPVWLSGNMVPAFILGAALTLVSWLGSNLLARQRLFTMVRNIGPFESLAYVLMPSAVMLFTTDTFGLENFGYSPSTMQWLLAATVFAIHVIELLLLLGLERLGLLTLAGWLARTLFSSLSHTSSTLATTLPISLGVVFFFFLNPGVWGTIGTLPPAAYCGVIGLLLLLAAGFLGSQRHLGLTDLTTFSTRDDFQAALDQTPMAGHAEVDLPATCPMTPLQNFCVRQVAVLSQLVVAFVVAAAVFALFMVIGYLAVNPAIVEVWIRSKPHILAQYAGNGRVYAITTGHLRVAGFLATFAAFNYSLASATDGRLRQNSKEVAGASIRQAAAMRLALLKGNDTFPSANRTTPDRAA